MSEALARFEARWLEHLNNGANTILRFGSAPTDCGLHSAVADAFVSDQGFEPIGFNWELLDAAAPSDAPRSARGELVKALANDIANPGKPWLGEAEARQCASQLLDCFDADALTVVSNRYDGLWNPISGKPVEWGFVLWDQHVIALLLIAGQ